MTKAREFTPEQEASIIARYKAGAGVLTLAREYGCSDKPIKRIIDKHGAHEPLRRFRGRYTPQQKQEMVDRYRAGESLNAIGQSFGCTVGNVKQILQRRGVERRPWGSPPVDPALLAAVRQRREDGESQQQIAAVLGISQSRVSQWLRRMGFPPDPHRSGPDHGAWKGGRYATAGGYWYVQVASDDPMYIMANYMGYVMEHRLVIARSIGRPLTRRETVHHINGNKADNRLENLQLRTGQHGHGVRMVCLDCGSHNVGAATI
jgi:DNA-directed RNA polymerase specialized sigma24 family protein